MATRKSTQKKDAELFAEEQVIDLWAVNMPRRPSSYEDSHVRIYHEYPTHDVLRDMSTVPWTEKRVWPTGVKNACGEFLEIVGLKHLPPHHVIHFRITIAPSEGPRYPTGVESPTDSYDDDDSDND